MSIKVMSWVMDDAPVENTTEMVVLYVLADHARDDGKCAWPSHSTIADKTRCSRRTVIRHIKALEQRGLIYRGDQRHVAHLPADKRPVVWNLNMTMKRQMPDDAGCQNVTPQSSGVTSSAERGDSGGTSGVTSSAERGDTGVTQPVLDPSVDPSLTHPPTPQGADGASAAEGDPAMARFQEFYDVYSRKKKRPEAERAWKKAVKKADPQVIIDAAAVFIESQKARNKHPQYTPFPASWLNGEQWNDEIDFPASGQHQGRSTNDLGDWLPPSQPTTAQLTYDADLLNANVIDHQEGF